MKPRRVLHILGTAQAEGTGVVRIVAGLARGLDPEAFRVEAWFLGADGPLVDTLRAQGASTRIMEWKHGARSPLAALRFYLALRREDFALIHQHYGGESVRRITRLASSARMIVHLHGRVDESRGTIPPPTRINGADAVIAVSRAVAGQAANRNVIVIPTGVPVTAGSPGSSLGVPDSGGVVLGTACRLVSVKGLEYLLAAVARLRTQVSNVRLEIAGTGPLQGNLEREVQRLGLADQVSFLGWRTDLPTIMKRWTVYIQASLEEGLPVAVLEAMAAGVPVVATTVGGIPEIVANGETGLLVPAGDGVALAEGVRVLIEDANLRERLRAAASDCVRTLFSEERMVASVSQVYREVLGLR